MSRQRNSPSDNMNNRREKAAQEKKTPENKFNDKEICHLNYREFRIVLLKKLNEIQKKKSNQHLQEIRIKIDELSFLAKRLKPYKRTK